MTKKILLDLSSIKTGGGAQRAKNFLNKLKEDEATDLEITILKTKNYFPEVDNVKEFKIINNPKNYLVRSIFNYLALLPIIYVNKYDLIFTFAGSGIPKGKAKSIVGIAYPIICYDESPFWHYLSKNKKISQKIKNHYRKKRIGKADLIFVQTLVMKERLINIYKNKKIKLKVFPPSPSEFISPVYRTLKPVYLILSGNGIHKNLWRLYEIAEELEKSNFKAKFQLSIDKNQWLESLDPNLKINLGLIEEYFNFMGKVKSEDIQKVYDESSFLLQLSDLESFSNNYMEAWKAGLPLIVSNRDFAKHICKDSAVYVEPHEPENVAKNIISLYYDTEKQEQMIRKGKELLTKLPTQDEYMKQMISLINYSHEKSN